jgi:hypothetical protein
MSLVGGGDLPRCVELLADGGRPPSQRCPPRVRASCWACCCPTALVARQPLTQSFLTKAPWA